jgi:hypothetical protein
MKATKVAFLKKDAMPAKRMTPFLLLPGSLSRTVLLLP